jgi:hypothetical protein
MELSTVKPKQSPDVPLVHTTPRQATRISQPRYQPSRGSPPGSNPFSTLTQELTTHTSQLNDPPNQTDFLFTLTTTITTTTTTTIIIIIIIIPKVHVI